MGPRLRHPPGAHDVLAGNREKMLMSVSVSVGAASAESDEAREVARDERTFFLVLAAVIALEGYGLVWFLG